MEKYTEIHQIGEGTFGKVFKVKDEGNKLFAIKKIRLGSDRGISIITVREIKALKRLKSKFIVELIEIFCGRSSINLVLEYLPFDLSGLIHRGYTFTDDQIESIAAQLINSLSFIHSKGMIHRDVKPSNILMDADGTVKITDFGLTRDQSGHMTNKVCTLWYRSPELLLGDVGYTSSVDSWSVACILLELKTGKAPFKGKDEISQVKEVFRILGRPSVSYPWDDLFALEEYPLKSDWACSIKEIFGEYFQGDLLVLITEMLQMDKSKRLSCRNAQELDIVKAASNKRIPIKIRDSHEYYAKVDRQDTIKTPHDLDMCRNSDGFETK